MVYSKEFTVDKIIDFSKSINIENGKPYEFVVIDDKEIINLIKGEIYEYSIRMEYTAKKIKRAYK